MDKPALRKHNFFLHYTLETACFMLKKSNLQETAYAAHDPLLRTPLDGHGAICVFGTDHMAAVAEWYRYRIVACLVTSSSQVPQKTLRVEQRCTLNLSRAETSSRWCGVVVTRSGASLGVVHVT
ncbi:uncharacterized protein TNCV_2562311 [Trichonephila clavipes]|uniref:Uncharacterized protein n=1 Tax=Trichonephila clavipes TaxID=2585209 RepID=A0A8X6R6H9_TRICX|nr:uncharacterized protein TNCV_2562311 [Trichonephila clavipes]